LVLPGPALDGASMYHMIESYKVNCRWRKLVMLVQALQRYQVQYGDKRAVRA
jgi:hypothetical protein